MILREKDIDIKISLPEDAVKILRSLLSIEDITDREKEHFWSIGLSAQNQVKYIDLVSLGTLNRSLVHPRETFRLAVLNGTASIIIGHNHPGGDPEPSQADKDITERLKQAGEILGISVLDHVILGEDSFYSFLSQTVTKGS